MTFDKPTNVAKHLAPERSDTAATIASIDVETPHEKRSNEPHPVPYGLPLSDGSRFGVPPGSVVADNRVFDAFRASQSLQCGAILDCCLATISALSFPPFWSLICLVFIPFGIIGRMAAKSYEAGKLLWVYIVYCGFAISIRLALAIAFGIYELPFNTVFEILKAITQVWFLALAMMFRSSVQKLTPDERLRLKEGRVAIARSEMLVYV